MYYYNEDGDMAWTEDSEEAQRLNVMHMLRSHTYPLRPEAAGRLYRALGPAPVNLSRRDALNYVYNVLSELGLSGIPIKDVLSVVDKSWKLVIDIGS